MCLVAVQGLKIDSMTGSEKFVYEVKQRKRNSVTGDPCRNSTWVVRIAGDTHDNTGLRKQPSFVSVTFRERDASQARVLRSRGFSVLFYTHLLQFEITVQQEKKVVMQHRHSKQQVHFITCKSPLVRPPGSK